MIAFLLLAGSRSLGSSSPSDIATATSSAHRQSLWAGAGERLRAAGDSLKEVGINVEVSKENVLAGIDKLLHVNVVLTGDNTIQFEFETRSGVPESVGDLHVSGSLELGEDVRRIGGKFSLSNEEQGISSEYAYNRSNGENRFTLEGNRSILDMQAVFNDTKSGPVLFGIKEGPLKILWDPYTMAKWVNEHRSELTESAREKIGGVSLSVNVNDLAIALARAKTPPQNFARNRLVVSLRNLAERPADNSQANLGALNHIDGLVVDSRNADILLLGTHSAVLPPIPTQIVSALARAIYVNRTQPFISIDPDGSDLTAPHHARLGGVSDDLRSSELIRRMLHADYNMKRFVMGTDYLQGLRSIKSLLTEHPEHGRYMMHRFWIMPRKLEPGDVRRGIGGRNTLITFDALPIVNSEAAKGLLAGGLDASDQSAPRATEPEAVAAGLTHAYHTVELNYPKAEFGELRQIIELSTAFSVLRSETLPQTCANTIGEVAEIPVPSVDVPMAYEPMSISFPGGTLAGGVKLGQTTPYIRTSGALNRIAGSIARPESGMSTTCPPIIDDVEPMKKLSKSDLAAELCVLAEAANNRQQFGIATQLLRQAAVLVPESEIPYVLLARVALGNRKPAEATDYATKAISKSSSSVEAHLIRAFALQLPIKDEINHRNSSYPRWSNALLAAKLENAQAEADWLVTKNPDLAYAHLMKAGIYDLRGNRQAAIEESSRAFELDPSNTTALLIQAEQYQKLSDWDKALQSISTYLTLRPDNFKAHVLAGNILGSSSRPKDALREYLVANTIDSRNPELHLKIARIYLDNDPASAARQASVAISLAPGLIDSYDLRAQAEDKQGLYLLAIWDLRKRAELGSPTLLSKADLSNIQTWIDTDWEHEPFCDEAVGAGDPIFLGDHRSVAVTKASVYALITHEGTDIDCKYTITNQGATRTVKMLFPETRSHILAWNSDSPKAYFSKFEAFVNDRQVKDEMVCWRNPGEQGRIVSLEVPGHRSVVLRQILKTPPNWVDLTSNDLPSKSDIDGRIVNFALSKDLWSQKGISAVVDVAFGYDQLLKPNPIAIRATHGNEASNSKQLVSHPNSFAYTAPVRPKISGSHVVFIKPAAGTSKFADLSMLFVSGIKHSH